MADLPIAEDNGQLPVTINDPTTTTSSVAVDPNGSIHPFADLSGTGTIAALNGAVVATTHGCGSCTFNVTGTWVATLSFQGTIDSVNWFTVYGADIGTDIITQFISTNVPVTIPCGGLSQVRLIATAYTSGTANIAWNAGSATKEVIVLSPVAQAFQTAVNGNYTQLATATWTSATALNSVVQVNTTGMSSVLFTWNPTGTISSGVLTFEESLDNGATWFPISVQFLALITAYSPTFGLSGQIPTIFQADVGGTTNFRIRLSTVIGGTGSGIVQLAATAFPQSPLISNVLEQGLNGNNTTTVASNANYGISLPAIANAAAPSWTEGRAVLESVTLDGYQRIIPRPSNLGVTATAATGVALTATLPAVAAQFHYISLIEIEAYSTAARTGGVTPVLVTSTNLPGGNVWSFASAAAIGTTDSKVFVPASDYRSSVVNTATTIVCPATTGIIWRINVMYYTNA